MTWSSPTSARSATGRPPQVTSTGTIRPKGRRMPPVSAHALRLLILELVRERELPAGAIASHFEVSRPAISQHLGVLKEAGLVDERRNGTQRLYRARPEGLGELKAFLDAFWGERLEARPVP